MLIEAARRAEAAAKEMLALVTEGSVSAAMRSCPVAAM